MGYLTISIEMLDAIKHITDDFSERKLTFTLYAVARPSVVCL